MPGRKKARGARAARNGVTRTVARKQSEESESPSQNGEMTIDDLRDKLKDFDVRVPKKIKQCVRAFEREAKRTLKNEVDQYKKTIPKNILKMPYWEFKARGGNIEDVMKSLSTEEVVQRPGEETKKLAELPPALPMATELLMTPALSTRRSVRIQASTAKRVAKPAERVVLSIQSEKSHSPLNEDDYFKEMNRETIDQMSSLMLEKLTAMLPQCHKSKVMRGIREVKAQVMETERDYTVTPGPARLRK